jgi:hypothetical protein
MLWEIAEDDGVAEIIDAACEACERFQDAWDGLLWLLAHNPAIGKDLGLGGTKRIHKQDSHLAAGVPEITILYEYNDIKIELRSVIVRHCDD